MNYSQYTVLVDQEFQTYTREGRNFTVTFYRPQAFNFFALNTESDKYNPRDYRQLDFISQFTTDIRHIKGNDNIVADTFSRSSLCSNTEEHLDIELLADDQKRDTTLFDSLKDSSLCIEQHPLPFSTKFITCNTSTHHPSPLVLFSMRKKKNLWPLSFAITPLSQSYVANNIRTLCLAENEQRHQELYPVLSSLSAN